MNTITRLIEELTYIDHHDGLHYEYSNDAQGELDPARLINGMPAFKRMRSGKYTYH